MQKLHSSVYNISWLNRKCVFCRVNINYCPIAVGVENPHKLGCAANFATLDKLVDKFTLPPAAIPIGDASLTHVIKLAAHSTTSATPTAMRQSFIMTP
jgi:hypothetical protein